MRKLLFITILCFGLLVPGFSYTQNKEGIRIPDSKDLLLKMDKYGIPALGIGIIEEGEITFTKVSGELSKGKEAPQNSLFQVASLTKPITEMTALRLVSKGLWNLDEPLYRYWTDPDVMGDESHKLLTTRHVITHQSGFVNWRWLHPTGKLTFDFMPGTRTQYSGEGLEYLKKALEARFRLPLEKIVDKYLFEPIGMEDSHFYWDGNISDSRFAIAHDKEGNPIETRKYYEASAADLLMTTIQDYTKFGQSVLKKDGLTHEVWEDMISYQSDDKKFGLGWELFKDLPNGEYALVHSGSDPGVRTIIVLLPKSRRGLVLLTNSDNGMSLIVDLIRNSLDVGEELIKRAG